jgi:hypothetical protein
MCGAGQGVAEHPVVLDAAQQRPDAFRRVDHRVDRGQTESHADPNSVVVAR